VINIHITENEAASEFPRYSENGAKEVGQTSRYALGYDSLFELYLEQELPGFAGLASILGDPPANQANNN